MNAMQTQITMLTKQLGKAQSENKDLLVKITAQEKINRMNNLKISGIYEHRKENKFDSKRMILRMLQNAGVNLHPKAITNTHRIGNKQQGRL